MKGYRYYLFDIDRTLWDFDLNAEHALKYLFERHNLNALLGIPDMETFFGQYQELNLRLWNSYEKGEITKEVLRNKRFQETFFRFAVESGKIANFGTTPRKQHIGIMEFGEKFSTEYMERMSVEKALEEGAEAVLKELKSRGCRIAAVSNGFKEVQYKKLSNAGIIGYMDAIIISEEIGAHKPSTIIFQRAVEALAGVENYADREKRGTIKAETLMVGDDFANDIKGARFFGIDQFYYNPKHKPSDGDATYESCSLYDLIR